MIKDEELPDLFEDAVLVELRIEDPSHLLGRHSFVGRKLLISKDDLAYVYVDKVSSLICTLNMMLEELESFYTEEKQSAKRTGSQ